MAMGMLVVPTDTLLMASLMLGTHRPKASPAAIAKKIHSVRKRSRNDSFRETHIHFVFSKLASHFVDSFVDLIPHLTEFIELFFVGSLERWWIVERPELPITHSTGKCVDNFLRRFHKRRLNGGRLIDRDIRNVFRTELAGVDSVFF